MDQSSGEPKRTCPQVPYKFTRLMTQKLASARSARLCGLVTSVHLTETCDEELPHLITHVETTVATTYDGAVTETIHAALEAKELLPEEHMVDSGYLDAEVLVSAEQCQKVSLIGPVAQDTSWQARDEHCFDKTQFTIDWQAQCVICLWVRPAAIGSQRMTVMEKR
jgi:transposase